MPWDNWHCMAGNAVGLMDGIGEFEVDGLTLEFDRSEDLPAHGWGWSFDDLALHDWMPELRKSGSKRDFALRRRAAVGRIVEETAPRLSPVNAYGSSPANWRASPTASRGRTPTMRAATPLSATSTTPS